MKRKVLLFVSIIAILTVASSLFLLVGCQQKSDSGIQELQVLNYVEDFRVGDIFILGEKFQVLAVDASGNKTDVTKQATIRQEKGFDMNVAGDYYITVEYGGKKATYIIYVSETENLLTAIKVDSSNLKKDYKLGEELDFTNIVISQIYVNGQGKTVKRDYYDTKEFDVTVSNSNQTTTSMVLTDFGKHTVTVACGDISDSFEINVSGVDLSSVQSALGVAKYGMQYVSSGKVDIKEVQALGGNTTKYVFEFGDNFTYIKETLRDAGDFDFENEYFLSLDQNGEIFVVTLKDGNKIPSNPTKKEAMAGVQFNMWFYNEQEYGIENALLNLYEIAKTNPNGDFVQNADSVNKKYSFSYGYKAAAVGNSRDYFFTVSAQFELNSDYTITNAKFEQATYSMSDCVVEGGVVKPKDSAMHTMIVDAEQVVGERTAVNQYSSQAMRVASFDLVYDGKVLNDGDVISGKVVMSSSGNYTSSIVLQISNVLPATADLTVDLPYLSDGTSLPQYGMFYGLGYSALQSENSNSIKITFFNGGDWDFVISTSGVTKRITLKVTGLAPTELSAAVYNASFNSFTKASEKSVMMGNTIMFNAIPNQYANAAVIAKITSDNYANANILPAKVDNQDCWSFSSDIVGKYVIVMTSVADSSISCTLTINVVDTPDFADILQGKYACTDSAYNTYTYEFATSSKTDEMVTGTLTVVLSTPDNTTSTQQFEFVAVLTELSIQLTPISGQELGISLEITQKGELAMRDLYETLYVLSAI